MAAMLKRISIMQVQRARNYRRSEKATQNTTEIHLVVDSYGLPAEFETPSGAVNDCFVAPNLIAKLSVRKRLLRTRAMTANVYENK